MKPIQVKNSRHGRRVSSGVFQLTFRMTDATERDQRSLFFFGGACRPVKGCGAHTSELYLTRLYGSCFVRRRWRALYSRLPWTAAAPLKPMSAFLFMVLY